MVLLEEHFFYVISSDLKRLQLNKSFQDILCYLVTVPKGCHDMVGWLAQFSYVFIRFFKLERIAWLLRRIDIHLFRMIPLNVWRGFVVWPIGKSDEPNQSIRVGSSSTLPKRFTSFPWKERLPRQAPWRMPHDPRHIINQLSFRQFIFIN